MASIRWPRRSLWGATAWRSARRCGAMLRRASPVYMSKRAVATPNGRLTPRARWECARAHHPRNARGVRISSCSARDECAVRRSFANSAGVIASVVHNKLPPRVQYSAPLLIQAHSVLHLAVFHRRTAYCTWRCQVGGDVSGGPPSVSRHGARSASARDAAQAVVDARLEGLQVSGAEGANRWSSRPQAQALARRPQRYRAAAGVYRAAAFARSFATSFAAHAFPACFPQ